MRGPLYPGWPLTTELVIAGARVVLGFGHRHLVLAQQRRGLSASVPPSLRQRIRLEQVELGPCGAEVHIPSTGEVERAVLYFHGGGYVLGNPAMYRELCARLADRLGARVWVPDYRLAPEHPYPAAIDDCEAAYRALLDTGIAAQRVTLMGDSAGGGLVLAVLQRLRAQGQQLPACGVLLSPWLDPGGDVVAPDPALQRFDYMSLTMLQEAAALYVGTQAERLSQPEVCLLRADLTGLPPLLLQTGSVEVLHAQHLAFGEAVAASGGVLDLRTFDGMVHVFQMFPVLPERRRALEELETFVGQYS